MVNLTQAHKASIELLETRHDALVEAVRNYVNGSVQPSIDELTAAIEDVTTDIDTKEKMLLGLASRQAKKPVPSLILDFKTRHYLQGARRPEKGYGIHDLLTVSRATPKWVYSASGKLTEVPANEPAYQHDPVTGEPLGLLIETSRTNLLTPSNDFTSWAGDAIVEATSRQFYAGETWSRLVTTASDTGDQANIRYAIFTYTAGLDYTLSVHVRAAELDVVSLRLPAQFGAFAGASVNINTGAIVETVGGVTAEQVAWTPLPDGSARVALTDTCVTTGTGQTRIYAGPLSRGLYDGVSGIETAGAQLEQGSTPSSYIPTTDSPATRAGDNVTRTLGAEFNASGFTIIQSFPDPLRGGVFQIGRLGNRFFVDVVGNDTNNRVVLVKEEESGRVFTWFSSALPWGAPKSIAFSVDMASGAVRFAVNGELANSGVFNDLGLLPEAPIMRMARSGALTNCMVLPTALTEAELVELTS